MTQKKADTVTLLKKDRSERGKKMTTKNSKTKNAIIFFTIFLLSIMSASAATISLSLGSYSSEIYKQGTVNIPVTVTATNITGTVNVVFSPRSGLSCDTCTLSPSFSGGTNEQQTVTFTLTGTQAGTYNPPFVSIGASSGSTTATSLSSGSAVTVVERPTWTKSFSADDSTININDQVTLTLTITPSGGSFSGVSADLTLPDGVTLISGSDPRSIGTISGQSSYQWIVKGTTAGSKSISVGISATSPQESASSNTERETITVNSDEETPPLNSGGSGGASGASGGGSAEMLAFGNFSGLKTLQVSNVNYSFTEITIGVNSAVTNAKIFVSKKSSLDSSYPTVGGTVYQYIVLESSQITDSIISGAKIKFKVENSWLSKNSFDASRIFLLRYNGNNWVEETTTKLSNDGFYTYYEASPRYLGTFAVANLPKASLEYLKLASLNPILSDIQAVISSGLKDATLTDKIGNYLAGTIDIGLTEEASKDLVKNLGISRAVDALSNTSKMTVIVKNNKNEPVSFMLVEAVPKSIVHDIYALKNFAPRIYDLIIREDPVIQWSFGEAETSIVAWEIKDLKPGDSAVFSYELDGKIDVVKYPSPIIIKPVMEVSTNAVAYEGDETEIQTQEKSSGSRRTLSIALAVITLLAIIGVGATIMLKGKGESKKEDNNTHIEKISGYVESQKNKGRSHEDIKQDLKNAGWDNETIEKGIHHKHNK